MLTTKEITFLNSGPISLPRFLAKLWQSCDGRKEVVLVVKDSQEVKIKGRAELGIFPVNICFPGGSDGKESACNTGDPGSIPG